MGGVVKTFFWPLYIIFCKTCVKDKVGKSQSLCALKLTNQGCTNWMYTFLVKITKYVKISETVGHRTGCLKHGKDMEFEMVWKRHGKTAKKLQRHGKDREWLFVDFRARYYRGENIPWIPRILFKYDFSILFQKLYKKYFLSKTFLRG